MREKIEIILKKDHIILKPKAEPRKGWEIAFKRVHENGDDQLRRYEVFANDTLKNGTLNLYEIVLGNQP